MESLNGDTSTCVGFEGIYSTVDAYEIQALVTQILDEVIICIHIFFYMQTFWLIFGAFIGARLQK